MPLKNSFLRKTPIDFANTGKKPFLWINTPKMSKS